MISIHAPRVGSDPCTDSGTGCAGSISIHAPRVGSDDAEYTPRPSPYTGFQSTLPVWGATPAAHHRHGIHSGFQSTLPVWGATYCPNCGAKMDLEISIHAPRVGSDLMMIIAVTERGRHFNPRSPCGERLVILYFVRSLIRYFNPRSPCGERQTAPIHRRGYMTFQSTLPVWGATWRQRARREDDPDISIHAPRVGSDRRCPAPYSHRRISIHAPRVGSDRAMEEVDNAADYFNPRSPCGERLGANALSNNTQKFQSTLPVWGATLPFTPTN